MRMLLADDIANNLLINRETAKALQHFFYQDVGYISASNIKVHDFIKQLDKFLL